MIKAGICLGLLLLVCSMAYSEPLESRMARVEENYKNIQSSIARVDTNIAKIEVKINDIAGRPAFWCVFTMGGLASLSTGLIVHKYKNGKNGKQNH